MQTIKLSRTRKEYLCREHSNFLAWSKLKIWQNAYSLLQDFLSSSYTRSLCTCSPKGFLKSVLWNTDHPKYGLRQSFINIIWGRIISAKTRENLTWWDKARCVSGDNRRLFLMVTKDKAFYFLALLFLVCGFHTLNHKIFLYHYVP